MTWHPRVGLKAELRLVLALPPPEGRLVNGADGLAVVEPERSSDESLVALEAWLSRAGFVVVRRRRRGRRCVVKARLERSDDGPYQSEAMSM